MEKMSTTTETNGHSSDFPKDSCDNYTKSKFKLIIFPIVIFFCALIVNYIIHHHGKTPTENISIVQPQSANDKVVKFDENNYDPEKMIKFLNNILKTNLEGFATIEKLPVNLTELSKFNNVHFAPLILSLVKLDPFKFVKFNLQRPCLLWPDTFSCSKTGCNIKFCEKSELPKAYLVLDENCPNDSPKELSKVDDTLTQTSVKELNRLFECSRDDSEDSRYYDLILNPERYTGYDGRQIWKAIYEENCFPSKNLNNIFSVLNNGCYEERIFYRIVSGLHTSITTHLTAIHHKFKDVFGPNPKDFCKRLYGHDDYIRNLFLTYLIELRALYKSQPYLLDKIKWNSIEDKVQAKEAIKALFNTEKFFKWHFDESILFKQEKIAEQLGNVFANITFNIMDCISCDKCRLWGKVQTNGLGTAFKILLTKDVEKLQLSHHEITCLLNAVARLSFSVMHVSDFRNKFQIEGGDNKDCGQNLADFLKS